MSLYVTELSQSRPNLGTQICEVTTLPEEISRSLKRNPSRVQYVTADGEEITARSFIGTCRNVARSLVAQGLSPNAGVAILAATDVRWFATDVGATLARTIPFGIYTTNSPEIVKHMLNDARAEIVFVDDHERFVKVLSVRAECPSVGHVVYWGDVDISQFPDHKDYVLSWDEFLRLGLDVSDKELEKRVEDVKPGDVCKLIYTSGTTGPPKAVMISHGNCTQTVESFRRFLSVGASDRIISYLPCSHIAANMIDIVGPLMIDMCIHIAPPNALRGSLVDTIRKVKPTIFLAVPRVWEKIHEKMVQIGAKRSFISRYISGIAKGIGTAACEAEENGAPMPFGLGIADRFIFSAVKRALGLDETRLFVNSTAPLQSATADYFRSLRIRILDLFGASEASGPFTCNVPEAYKRGTSGKCFPGVEVKVANPNSNGEGELCFRGPNIFMGYLNKEEESAKAIDKDGFFHTGDVGTVDEDGFVTVTGRIKELLITAAGENVAPLLVEQTVTEAMSAIDRAFAVGDQRKFISCLVVPRMDANGMLIDQAREVNPNIGTAEEARNDDIWKKYLEEGMKRANGNAISNAASVKKWSILTNDFSVEGGELTPTMKVKRKVVVQKYNDIIEAIYQ